MAESTRPPRIGKHISQLRRDRQITLERLSRLSGVSKSMLFQIEQERVNPSIITVWKIARGLNVTFPTILSGEHPEEKPFEILRKSDVSVVATEDSRCKLRVTSNVHFLDTLETYDLSVEPGGALRSKPHFPGTEEILAVMKGRLRVTAGGKSVELKKGDSARYRVDTHHAIENTSASTAEAFLIVLHKDRTHAQGSR